MSRTMTTSARPAASPSELSTDRLAERLLAGPATVLLGVVCLLQLLTWLPHYLTWPLWADHDAFATLARGWEAGQLPYRDLACNQFPGLIYLFWILGRVAGWGNGASIYTFDAGTVLLLGLALILWSKRLFGTLLPGVVGYLCFLSYYLSLDYSLAAQRDWHAPFFAVLGILLLQTWEGRTAAPAFSAAAVATAILIRPHAVLFLPALALQLIGEMQISRGVRRSAVWTSSFLLTILLGLAPLASSGLLLDFLTGVTANNSSGQHGIARLAAVLAGLFNQLDTFAYVVVALAVVLMPKGDPRRASTAAVWVAAFLMVLLYRPIHPRNHAYLALPLAVVFAVNVGVLTDMLLSARRVPVSFRLLSLLLLLGASCKTRPEFCSVRSSLWAASGALRGQTRASAPPGYRHGPVPTAAFYDWADYRATLDYLRRHPSRQAKIANALKGNPAIVGALGRISAFPAENISWIWMANRGDEERFARSLENEPDSLVVWSPGEAGPDPSFRIDRIEAAIRRLYEPDARFGAIEVWRRKGASVGGATVAAQPAAAPRVGG
jgi:hypothetical protein